MKENRPVSRSQWRAAVRSRTAGVLLVASLVGCTAAKSAGGPDLFWPDPPDKPRIKYVGSLQSRGDVGTPSFREVLLGNDQVASLYQPMGLALSEDQERLYVVDRA